MRTIRAAVAAHFGGLPARFWWLWAGGVVSAFGTFVFLFLAVYLASRGFSPRAVGLVVSADGVGSLAAAPVAGWLADRIGRRPTLLAALAATAAAAIFLGLARTPAPVVAGVLAFGTASAMIFPALFAMVADLVPERDLERGFGVLYWAFNVGVAFSATVGGAIGERSWLALFLADAATTLVFAAIVWWRVPETRPASAAPPAGAPREAPAAARGWGAVLRDRAFVSFWIVFVVYALVFWQFQVAGPLSMAADGLGPAAIGRVLAVNGLVIFALQPFSPGLVARHDAGRVLAGAAALVGVGYGAYALAHGVLAYAAGTAIWSIGEVLTTPVASALVARLAPPDLRGRYQGAFALAFGAGRALAPVLGGAALERLGPPALWTGCLGVALVAAAGHLALGASRRRHQPETRSTVTPADQPPTR